MHIPLRTLRVSVLLSVCGSGLTTPSLAQWVEGANTLSTDDKVVLGQFTAPARLSIQGLQSEFSGIYVRQGFPTKYGIYSRADSFGVTAIAGVVEESSSVGVQGVAMHPTGTGTAVSGSSYSPFGYSGRFSGGKFTVDGEFFGVNRDAPLTPTEVFGISADTTSWGGMYIETDEGGNPYYGYSTNGTNRCYTYYDSYTNQWRVWAGGPNLSIDADTGRVGIRTINPNYVLHVNGTAGKPGGGSWSNASDVRLKENVEPIDDALDRLLAIRGVTYEYIDPDAILELHGVQTGVVAQEVEAVFPGWVDEGPDGFKRVTFRGFEGVTIEALRELRDRGDELQAENDALHARLDAQAAALAALQARLDAFESADKASKLPFLTAAGGGGKPGSGS